MRPRVRIAHIAIALGALLAVSRAASAECILPPIAQASVFGLTTPAARYTQALTYADHQCLAEARALLKEAAAGLDGKTGGRELLLRNFVRFATDYVGALEALNAHDNQAAYTALRRIIQAGMNVVSLRAVLTLGKAIVANADPATWATVDEPLQELSRRGYVEADILLVERVMQSRGLPAGIADVEQRLQDTEDLQRALSLEVFLIELYSRASRWVDAELLLSQLEPDAADTLLDLGMRHRLLAVGVAVSDALVQQGRAEFTLQRDAYARALAEIRRFVR
jgi:hypothetical protein